MHVSEALTSLSLFDFSPYKRLWVAFSGGIDSTALLHALSHCVELKSKLTAIHVNHNIHQQSPVWQNHCEVFCKALDIPIIIKSIKPHYFDNSANIEEAARDARYHLFEEIIEKNEALILGHHQNDQAETLLLRLFRGAGIEGLSAMKPIMPRNHITLLRPWLTLDKKNIVHYANQNKLTWVEDPSNLNEGFDRNFIRNTLLPLIKTRYPGVNKNLARTALLCDESQKYINAALQPNFERCLVEQNVIDLTVLLALSKTEQTLIIRQWLKSLTLKMPNQSHLDNFITKLTLADNDKHPLLSLDNMQIQRHNNKLYAYLALTVSPENKQWPPPFSPLLLLGLQANLSLKKDKLTPNLYVPKNAIISVKFRKGGEKIKVNGLHQKVKKLLQAQTIPFWERAHLPLIYINEELAAISTLIIADNFNQMDKNNHKLYISKL